MYYTINEAWKPCGWKRLPFALKNRDVLKPRFFDRETYAFLLKADGTKKLEIETESEATKKVLRELIKDGILLEHKEQTPSPLSEYRLYPTGFRSQVHWSITGHCNYRCKHCMMCAPQGKFPHPSLEELICIADNLEKCGVHTVELTGGEPLIRTDFMQLVDALIQRDLRISVIFSNGRLVTEELLTALKERDVKCSFQMSFDGVQGWHDWIRGVEGASLDVERAIKLCVKHGFPVSIAMCLHQKNISVFRESVQYLASLGVASLKVNAAFPEGEWKKYPEYFLSTQELYQAYLDYIPQYFADNCPLSLQLDAFFDYTPGDQTYYNYFERDEYVSADQTFICSAMNYGFYIGSDGSVVPCMSMAGNPVACHFYNLHDTDLKDILDNSNLVKAGKLRFRAMIEHNPECARCEYNDRCSGGCRARATGDHSTDILLTEPAVCEFFRGGWDKKIHEHCDEAFQAYLKRMQV